MARKVAWTAPAWDDLEVAADYIARDSKFYAASFVEEVRDAAESLADLAQRGKPSRSLASNPFENSW